MLQTLCCSCIHCVVGEGIAEALHCFTSRPYVLKAVDSIYSNNQASTVYFITLTLAADILCIALIVAVGAKHYKQFAGNILNQRLIDRRHAISCAFRAVASCCATKGDIGNAEDTALHDTKEQTAQTNSNNVEKEGNLYLNNGDALVVTKDDWISMCSHIGGKYSPTPHTAAFIFDLVVDGDPREYIDESGEQHKKFVHTMDEYLFFRCCALVATRIVIQVESTVRPEGQSECADGRNAASGDGFELPTRLSMLDTAATNTGENIGLSVTSDRDVMTVFSPSIGANIGNSSKQQRNSDAEEDQEQGGTQATSGTKNPTQERLAALQTPSNYHVSMLAVDADLGHDQKERRSSLKVLRVSERHPSERHHGNHLSLLGRPSRQRPNATYLEAQLTSVLDVLYYYLKPVRDVCVQITGTNVTVGGGSDGSGRKYTINLFYAVNMVLLVLLVSNHVLAVL